MKQFVVVACIVALLATMANAGSRDNIRSLALTPMKVDDGRSGSRKPTGEPQPSGPASITWFAVDTMANAFGPASRGVKPMAYDSATNTVALIHRGATSYAQGSGELWYNISRNAGVSWRRVGGLNSGAELLSRYPSCAIANPTSSRDTGVVYFVYGSYAVSVRQTGILLTASFRSRTTPDTLAVWLMVPPVKVHRELAPQVAGLMPL